LSPTGRGVLDEQAKEKPVGSDLLGGKKAHTEWEQGMGVGWKI